METLISGAVSLAAGILGGIVFGKLMYMILLRLLRYDIGIAFHVSGLSVMYTGFCLPASFSSSGCTIYSR